MITSFIIFCAFIIICISFFLYLSNKQHKRWYAYIQSSKMELENAGFVFNHSYRLTSKKTGKIAYIRLYDILYSPDKKKVMVHAYMVSKDGEIGTWYDDCNYLLDIPNRWDLEDCGEWNPND